MYELAGTGVVLVLSPDAPPLSSEKGSDNTDCPLEWRCASTSLPSKQTEPSAGAICSARLWGTMDDERRLLLPGIATPAKATTRDTNKRMILLDAGALLHNFLSVC